VLELREITVRYGGLTALAGLSFSVEDGAFVALIGANGAGKTTAFKAICGTVEIAGGGIFHNGVNLSALDTFERARRGIGHVPEGRHVFKTMTVAENIQVGSFACPSLSGNAETEDLIYGLFPRLAARRRQVAGTLSGGEQQMLAIARALAGQPSLLLLDEPSMGLAPTIVDEIFQCIRKMHAERGISILLVEQRVVDALELCDGGHVLQNGRIVLSGPPQFLMSDPRVRDAYIGG
jgi:branched-chain amino acid transport system ATP-binding protein